VLTELFNVPGVPVDSARVSFGTAEASSDSGGNYEIFVRADEVKSRLTFERAGFLKRETALMMPKDTTIDQILAGTQLNLAYFDEGIRGRSSQGYATTLPLPNKLIVRIDTTAALNPDSSRTRVPQSQVDQVISIFNNEVAQFSDGKYNGIDIRIVNTHDASNGFHNVYWDNTLPGAAVYGTSIGSNNVVVRATSRFWTFAPKSAMLKGIISATIGGQHSDKTLGVFNGAGYPYLTEQDLLAGKLLWNRDPGLYTPDQSLLPR